MTNMRLKTSILNDFNSKPYIVCTLLFLFFGQINETHAYEPNTGHAFIFSLAIEQFLSCHQDKKQSIPDINIFTKRLIQGNVAMDKSLGWNIRDRLLLKNASVFSFQTRTRNWHFYNSKQQKHAQVANINQSMTNLWDEALVGFHENKKLNDKLLFVGALAHLLEDATVPAHITPIYHGPTAIKFLNAKQMAKLVNYMKERSDSRFVIHDNLDKYPVEVSKLRAKLRQKTSCGSLAKSENSVSNLLLQNERFTQILLETPIIECSNFVWKSFWTPPKENEYFGRYNIENENILFGEKGNLTDSNGASCSFDKDDVRYREFAQKLHLQAIETDVRLLETLLL